MKNARMLYIEDDFQFADLIKKYLEKADFEVDIVDDSIAALNMIKEKDYDLVLTDLNLEKLNGNQVVEMVKKHNPAIKVALFTCSKDQFDELQALKTGADDYIRKETSFEILVARLKRLINENHHRHFVSQLSSELEKITLNVKDRVTTKNGEMVSLTKLEFDLLKLFLENKNVLLSRRDIYENIWHTSLESADIDLRNIDSHIKNLRKKLDISAIVSIRSVGYRWHE
ncbi:response regulator transcription factor [Erysipelotrichaceae bacterium OttesenSCG-928-M19]|nr:response regulator transcription factor [Erysipelotrichaceae bacterium OttesenSCG-928-M19]